jgi:uncharacterized membrane protein YebE (DUF533 family)
MSDNAQSLADLLAPPPLAAAPAPVKIFETIVLRFLARVIHADGTIDPKELSMLTSVATQMGLDEPDARRVLADELERKSDCAVLAAQISDRTQQREVFAMGCLVGVSDGHVGATEQAVLGEFARGAQIPESDAQAILDAVVVASRGTKA